MWIQDFCCAPLRQCAALLNFSLTSAADALLEWGLLTGVPELQGVLPQGRWTLAPGLWECQGLTRGTHHELHSEEAVAASPQAGLCQQAVDPIGDAPVKLQLPLHHLALPLVQEKGALADGVGRGGHGKA